MSKLSVFKKSKGILKVQNYVANFGDIDAIQNVGRQKSRVMRRGALLTKAPLGELLGFERGSGSLSGLDSVLQDVFAVSFSTNFSASLLVDEQVFLWADSITTLPYDIAEVLDGVDIRVDLENQNDEIENM